MNTTPIPADILERRGGRVSRDIDGTLIFGFTAKDASGAVEWGPERLTRAFMRGDLDDARWEAQRIALARDALPTQAERAAIPYKDRLTRALADTPHA